MKHLIFYSSLSSIVHSRRPRPNRISYPQSSGNADRQPDFREKGFYVRRRHYPLLSKTFFREEVLSRTPIKWQKKESKADICWITDSSLPPEGYRIKIHPQQMVISASDKGGFTYAVQTLRQWAAGSAGSITFACASVTDYPRTQWRCFLLDSGRQFQKIATIRKYIDMASLLKMNYFHWHLTEGLGWRIENQAISAPHPDWRFGRQRRRTAGILYTGRNTGHHRICPSTEYHHRPRNRYAGPCRSCSLCLSGARLFRIAGRDTAKRIYPEHILCRKRRNSPFPEKRTG